MKKTIAYILIAIVAMGAIYYLYSQKNGSVTGTGIGSSGSGGTPFERDDDAAYNSMRAFLSAGELSWVDPLTIERFNTTPELIGGQKSKAATFLKTIGAVAPNPAGQYPPASWSGTTPLLWPDSTIGKMWDIQNSLTAKYNKL
jgi:hypothetical protein